MPDILTARMDCLGKMELYLNVIQKILWTFYADDNNEL